MRYKSVEASTEGCFTAAAWARKENEFSLFYAEVDPF